MYRRDLKAPLKKPPLCKGRWVGVSRAGGVVFFKSVRSAHTSSVRIQKADAVELAVSVPEEIELELLALLDALEVLDVL